jgi:hypothetical protein
MSSESKRFYNITVTQEELELCRIKPGMFLRFKDAEVKSILDERGRTIRFERWYP